jgi:hypothetical protein
LKRAAINGGNDVLLFLVLNTVLDRKSAKLLISDHLLIFEFYLAGIAARGLVQIFLFPHEYNKLHASTGNNDRVNDVGP